ncbi:hypothetical protein [Microvirga puerhi]|uniref:DUF4239 domain-containing protein n=1 Tax=Microvirga puerhi TaxID=2876078 RepID=A0ABS7VHY9_9HYPH|nr:hypothetical protein [Microvirga puerhi]MBZ6075126.1 hypothetical protein [Microvirga puerhi]
MNSLVVSLLTFAAIFGGALLGIGLARVLPAPHLNTETRTAVSVSMAVVGTLAALVLGLMITTASSAFSARSNAIDTLAVDIAKLDRILSRLGPGASSIREDLRSYAKAKAEELAAVVDKRDIALRNLTVLEGISDQVSQLSAEDARFRHNQSQALLLVDSIADARWRLVEDASISIPLPFLIIVIFWLSLLFASFGLFAPNNATVVIALFLCAVAISGGIFLILELGTPTRGFIRASVEPLQLMIKDLSN